MNRLKAPISIVLDSKDIDEAKRVAETRTAESIKRGFVNRHGYNGNRLKIDLIGCYGEIAFCKAMGIAWNKSVNSFKLPDASYDVQVRTTEYKTGKLILRNGDNKDHLWVLVTGTVPYLTIQGWIKGREGMGKDEFIRSEANRPPAWFIPSEALERDMSLLLQPDLLRDSR